MTKVTRLETPAFSFRIPYFRDTSRFEKSLRNGTVKLFLAANSLCDGVLSVLIPKTLVSLSLNFAIPAWYALNSAVQPPVNAAG
jgi:hypothetical protein